MFSKGGKIRPAEQELEARPKCNRTQRRNRKDQTPGLNAANKSTSQGATSRIRPSIPDSQMAEESPPKEPPNIEFLQVPCPPKSASEKILITLQ
jgi:hypothetical protein